MKSERLDKLLSGTGLYTRAQARAAIASGAVTVDGRPALRGEEKVSRSARIAVGGRAVDTSEHVYYVMNKPAGYISGARAEGPWPSVLELLPEALRGRGLFCAGRLDADAEGLLLLTDDGAYAHRVMSPRSGVRKTYEVRLDAPLTREDLALLASGPRMTDGAAYRPAEAEPSHEPTLWRVTVTEGRYHEVKNLMALCGRRVLRLRRVRVGALALDPALPAGQCLRLTEEQAQEVFINSII